MAEQTHTPTREEIETAFDMPAVLMIGNVAEGWRIVGPFATHDDATDYSDKLGLSGLESWVATIEKPEEDTRD